MQNAARPVVKDLVLLGGGHSHLSVLRHFAMRPLDGLRITLVSEVSHAAYSGMLPGLIAGTYGFDDTHIDLVRLSRAAGARFIRAQAVGLSCSRHLLRLAARPDLPFDLLSINVGSTPDLSKVPGAADQVLPIKPVAGFLRRWQHLEQTLAEDDRPVSLGVVGAGAGGVEIALALRRSPAAHRRVTLRLFEAAPAILPGFAAAVRRRLLRSLENNDISVHCGRTVAQVDDRGLVLDDGSAVALDHVIWTTGAAAPAWLRSTDLALDDRGFVAIDETLRARDQESVFAAGDAASMVADPRPKSGVFAVRQGPKLAANLRRCLLGQPLRPYRPQRRFLSLISQADGSAVAARGAFSFAGALAWRWKDRIDRRFMARFSDLPAMTRPRPRRRAALPDAAALNREAEMRCRGCGAKMAGDALDSVLTRLRADYPSTVYETAASRDDAAVTVPPPGQELVQSVDLLPAPLSDPFLFGQIAATHCLSDLYAMAADPWTALAVAGVPFGSPCKREDELYQLLAGACLALEQAGVRLIGGHSGETAETSLGLTVNGLARPGQILRKSGLRAGQLLVLTKPLGSGVLLAAEMRGRAKGRWLDEAVAAMLRANRDAAACLRDHGASGMTDVTGFGLAGHLLEMLIASSVDAEIDADALPTLSGARSLLDQGLQSSLAPSNQRQAAEHLQNRTSRDDSVEALLFDPQTSGGLLAGIPEDRAAACLAQLHRRGDPRAAVIGRVEPRNGPNPRITIEDDGRS